MAQGEKHMRKPVAYIKYREISFMRAVRNEGVTGWHTNLGLAPEEGDVPLYEGKEWVGLTDDEVTELFCDYDGSQFPAFVRNIEAKLKEKNT
jgi:hypothetical protein